MPISSNRPDSFFGVDEVDQDGKASGAAMGIALGGGESTSDAEFASASSSSPKVATKKKGRTPILSTSSALDGLANSIRYPTGEPEEGTEAGDGAEDIATRARPSSFFGMEQPLGHVPNPNDINKQTPTSTPRLSQNTHNGSNGAFATPGTSSSTNTNTTGTDTPIVNRESSPSPASIAPSQSASNYGSADRSINGATRPISMAPTLNGPLLDHSHLRPGQQAALLSHNKTLELYRQNAKKTNDPDLIYELAVFMIDNAKSMEGDDSSGGSGPGGSGSSVGAQGKLENDRDELVKEAIGLLKKIADRGHPDAQYYLADCYANGIGTPKNKQDFDKAYPLFVLAAKHGHPDAAYRAGMCFEKGWGCRRDAAKAVQFYRKAGAQSHPGAMYRLGTAELNGDLGLKKSAREGVKWLKRAAEAATPEFPHALHELALLHERGVDNVLFADPEYACELLAQAGEMGYAPSAYKLGVNYEYGRMGCPQDAGLSIHMYNIAAQQNHKEACFALTAWYLVGAPGILPQSDTEAYLWAKKAAEQGLAKAEYAVGYFTESGIGCVRDMRESKKWYRAAADHGDKRAHQRLVAMGAAQPEQNGFFGALSKRRGSEPAAVHSSLANGQRSEPPLPEKGPLNPRDQGLRVAATEAQRQQMALQQSQPPFSPFDGNVRSPASSVTSQHFPNPMQMRESQTAQRNHAHQMAIQHHQEQQQRGMRGPPPPMGPGGPIGFLQRSGAPSVSSTTSLPQSLTGGSEYSHHTQSSRGPPVSSPLQQSPQLVRPNSPPLTALQTQFQNLHMRPQQQGSPIQNPLPRPPPMSPPTHDFLRHGPPTPVQKQPSSPAIQSPRQSHGSMPPSHQQFRQNSMEAGRMPRPLPPPQGAEVAYLQQRPPPPQQNGRPFVPPGMMAMQNGMRPPPFRPQQRQNSAPPSPSTSSTRMENYPTYLNKAPSSSSNGGPYRPGIPVLQQPPELIGQSSGDAERKKSLWAQLKAI